MSDARVFVSYARSTEPAARRLAEALRAEGFDVWRDDALPPHRAYADVIRERLGDARAVVVIWSADAVQSQWVRAEADFARNQKKLVQVRIDGCELPMPFDQIQCLDLSRWRGGRSAPAWRRLVETVRELQASPGETQPLPSPEPVPVWRTRRGVLALSGGAAATGLAVGGGYLGVRSLSAPHGPPLLAMAPFENLGGADTALVEGLWEDTRGALSTNPNLRVLGRTTIEALKGQNLDARGYRSRLGVDYLLEASVRRAADAVRIEASLVRAADAVNLWTRRFDAELKDVLSLQTRIAAEIEGHIRGLLAPEGGRRAQNIPTSPEVYDLYNQARAITRDRAGGAKRAILLLRKAVELDPNYAPAWAALAIAERLGGAPDELTGDEYLSQIFAAVAKATELAPNLALGWGAYCVAHDNAGPDAERAGRRAVALDPNYAEGWMWLASTLMEANRREEALKAYSRAVEIEPLWRPAVMNRLNLLRVLGRREEVEKELKRLERSGERGLVITARVGDLRARGEFAAAARLALNELGALSARYRVSVNGMLASMLFVLGYRREAGLIWKNNLETLALYDGKLLPPGKLVDARYPAIDLWRDGNSALLTLRLMVRDGRLKELVGYYHAAFRSPEDMREKLTGHQFCSVAPELAAVLAMADERSEAAGVLNQLDSLLADYGRNGPLTPEQLFSLGMLKAQTGRIDAAAKDVQTAVDLGLPFDDAAIPNDFAAELSAKPLIGHPVFEAVRKRVLDKIAAERAKLGAFTLPA